MSEKNLNKCISILEQKVSVNETQISVISKQIDTINTNASILPNIRIQLAEISSDLKNIPIQQIVKDLDNMNKRVQILENFNAKLSGGIITLMVLSGASGTGIGLLVSLLL